MKYVYQVSVFTDTVVGFPPPPYPPLLAHPPVTPTLQAKLPIPPHFMWASLSGSKPVTLDGVLAKRKRRAAAMTPPPPSKRLRTEALTSQEGRAIGVSTTVAVSRAGGSVGQHTTFAYEESFLEVVDSALQGADHALGEMFEALAPDTLLIVLTQPDLAVPWELTRQRTVCFDHRATARWSEEDERLLNELVREAQTGRIFLRVK
jgi:hypothetical protein